MIDGLRRGKPAFLASVTNAGEADIALKGGADIIDCKDPASGALGALSAETVRSTVAHIAGRLPVSATVGDLPADAQLLTDAVARMVMTGIDIVKVGFFGDLDPRPAIAAIGRAHARSTPVVAVLMADRSPEFSIIADVAAAGFAGVMLDTADKSAGRLTSALAPARLADFVRLAGDKGLFVGLAGSLTADDIPALAKLQPDMLGFRGALCSGGRVNAIEANRVGTVRQGIDAAKRAIARETTSA
jgi:(5-formylfuran-3-yl)methyl phosphate synthase